MDTKTCASCGRLIEWRKKWADCWGNIRFCSKACRRNKPGKIDRALEEAILALLSTRDSQSTICPSEAARAVFPENRWRSEMERTRRAARRLVAKEKIHLTQQGKTVDPSHAKGPIRLAMPNR